MKTARQQHFEEIANRTPRVLGASAYACLLEQLVSKGKGYGKTEPVAAYPLKNIRLARETAEKAGKLHEIEMPELYVVMDVKVWRNEYIRQLCLEDIATKWSLRLVEEGDINGQDFKGPGVWTAEKKVIENDYIRGDGVDDHGNKLHVYDPNPDATSVCLNITDTFLLPTPWGKPYPVEPGSTLTIRERDIPDLIEALTAIRKGEKTGFAALLKVDASGNISTRFDIYAMEPGFLRDNYNPVPLKPQTRRMMGEFRKRQGSKLSVVDEAEEMLPPALEEMISRFTFSDLEKDSSAFGAGGARIALPEDRIIIDYNCDLIRSFIRANNYLLKKSFYKSMSDIIDPWSQYGRKSLAFTRLLGEATCFEEQVFLQRLGTRFAAACSGTVHIAAEGASADSHFRLFDCPALMKNPRVTHVQVVEGGLVKDGTIAYVDAAKGVFYRSAAFDQWDIDRAVSEKDIHLIGTSTIFNETLDILSKNAWYEEQQQAWFDAALENLCVHLEDRPSPEPIHFIDGCVSQPAKTDMAHSAAEFLKEAVLLLHQGCMAGAGMRQRLEKVQEMFTRYPELLDIDAPVTTHEFARSHQYRWGGSRTEIMTQHLGVMLLTLDDNMSLEQKNSLWGHYKRYEIKDGDRSTGQPDVVENYVRCYLQSLPQKIAAALELSAPQKKPGRSAHHKM